MKTLQAIKLLLEEYKQHIDNIVAGTEANYNEQVEKAKEETNEKLSKLSLLFPDLIPNDNGNLTADEINTLITQIKQRVKNKYSAPLLPSGKMLTDTIYGTKFTTPTFTAWQGATSKEANYVIQYDKSSADKAIKLMNNLVGNMLLSLPIKRVHLNFVDLNYSGGGQFFTKQLNESLFSDLIVDTQSLNDFCKEMQQRMVSALQDCGSLVEYNEENKCYHYPYYEVVVLLDYPKMYDYVAQQLAPLFENGHKGGIYFVVLHNTEEKLTNSGKSLIDMKDHYTALDAEEDKIVSYFDNKSVTPSIFKYIDEEAKAKPEAKKIKPDYEGMFKQPYAEIDRTIEIPIGEDASGNKINFLLNTIDHIHSFIMGRSGSGKSVFVHNIIAGAMLKYSPEDLQFYLLDFKMGGVEFNRYRESKHVRALLVDNSDMQVTLEILHDLQEQMKNRGKQLSESGVNNITDYNRANPGNRMPQILFVVDECHAMFSPSTNDNRKLFREMSEIIELIAKEGRNQGIHIIFATQTLANSDISSDILGQMTDRYLLWCEPSDSEKMIPDSSKKTATLSPGQVYYRFRGEQEFLFQSYFTDNDAVPTLTKRITTKAADNNSNGQFYFNGSQIFALDDKVIDKLPSKRNNVAALGCSVDLKREIVQIPLKVDDGENILFFGINDQEQVTRTVMNALTSLLYTAKNSGRMLHTYVIDCLGKDDGKYLDVLDKLEGEGVISLIDSRDAGKCLHRMAKGIQDGDIEPSLLVILGQERMRGLKLDRPIEGAKLAASTSTAEPDPTGADFNDNYNKFNFGNSSVEKGPASDISTYRKALAYILDNGPRVGINTLLQIDVPSKLIFEDFANAKYVYNKFNHLVMLRADEKAAVQLGLNGDIHLEQLPSVVERLRAIYYQPMDDEYQMFTPYVIE